MVLLWHNYSDRGCAIRPLSQDATKKSGDIQAYKETGIPGGSKLGDFGPKLNDDDFLGNS